jgi:hypothetical protein
MKTQPPTDEELSTSWKNDTGTPIEDGGANRPAAFQAVYADFKLIKTRGVTQFIFEVPIEHSDAAYQVLGGMPVQGESVWVAIARIEHETQRTKS